MGKHLFGCDICQDVCPWNRKSPRTELAEFKPRAFAGIDGAPDETLFLPDLLRIARLTLEQFHEVFRGSPVKRSKWQGLVRNACIALGNQSSEEVSGAHYEITQALHRLSQCSEPAIAESAGWALSRIQAKGNAQHPASFPTRS
jgi:epoxyqueuosine reductase